jgi:hypothetical protein
MSQPSETALRAMIANAEDGLRKARSPRQRLGHLFRLALARDALATRNDG